MVDKKKIKKLDIAKFREIGLLAEVNRLFFHPLGLALEVNIDDETGKETLGGIWDYRDDPEGILYEPEFFEKTIKPKMERARAFIDKRHRMRRNSLGFVVQGEFELIKGKKEDT
jgi:hypothetical protein